MAGSQRRTRPGAPTTGDLIVRNLVGGFEVIDVDGKRIVGPVDTFAAAYHRAKVEATGEVWQQSDQSSRPTLRGSTCNASGLIDAELSVRWLAQSGGLA